MCGYTFFYANVPGIVTPTVIYRVTINVNAKMAVAVYSWRFPISAFGIL